MADSAPLGIPLRPQDFPIGKPIPYSVYDPQGNLLLRKGFVLTSERQRVRLLERGLIRLKDQEQEQEQALLDAQQLQPDFDGRHRFTVFEAVEVLIARLGHAYRLLQGGSAHLAPYELGRIALDIQQLCHGDAAPILGAMQLTTRPYSLIHPLHAAVIGELIARRLDITQLQRLPLVVAALSHDLGIHRLQEQLHQQTEPLSDAQWRQVQRHPRQGAQLLRQAGVQDELWLAVIEQHHERLDGSGYPRGLKGEQICREARILAIADIYTAMIRPKPYRDAHLAKDALRSLFRERGETVDPTLVELFIRKVGIFPPGGFVRLKNGEIAVIKGPGHEPSLPLVVSVMSATGESHPQPCARDPRRPEFAVVEMLPHHQHPALNGQLNQLWPPVDPIATV